MQVYILFGSTRSKLQTFLNGPLVVLNPVLDLFLDTVHNSTQSVKISGPPSFQWHNLVNMQFIYTNISTLKHEIMVCEVLTVVLVQVQVLVLDLSSPTSLQFSLKTKRPGPVQERQ